MRVNVSRSTRQPHYPYSSLSLPSSGKWRVVIGVIDAVLYSLRTDCAPPLLAKICFITILIDGAGTTVEGTRVKTGPIAFFESTLRLFSFGHTDKFHCFVFQCAASRTDRQRCNIVRTV